MYSSEKQMNFILISFNYNNSYFGVNAFVYIPMKLQ